MQEREDEVLNDGDKENSGVNDAGEVEVEDGRADTGQGGEAGESGKNLEDIMEDLAREKARAEDYYNRLVRMQADFENYRKRVAKDRDDLLKYAGEQIITMLLPVLDNMERALSVRHEDAGKVYEGFEMIDRQMREILEGEGIKAIPTVGEQFNPEIHEAVMREENSQYPENTVIEELRKGYTLKGKVIRAAMVKVAV